MEEKTFEIQQEDLITSSKEEEEKATKKEKIKKPSNPPPSTCHLPNGGRFHLSSKRTNQNNPPRQSFQVQSVNTKDLQLMTLIRFTHLDSTCTHGKALDPKKSKRTDKPLIVPKALSTTMGHLAQTFSQPACHTPFRSNFSLGSRR